MTSLVTEATLSIQIESVLALVFSLRCQQPMICIFRVAHSSLRPSLPTAPEWNFEAGLGNIVGSALNLALAHNVSSQTSST